ncbi:MAG: putative DNA binding domain-containing protein [Deltaproteobacteria bacterium]|nr:putative DNA binding domain-containing protein [Deltaproteobacteria bacterium]
MSDMLDQLARWMAAPEDEHLEFKEANQRFDFELLVKYGCAFANEGGGRIILGVSDQRPRRVVGSQAFEDLQRTKLGLIERLRLRVEAWELQHEEGRVLVFAVPSRPVGVPIEYNGAYWMRGGESLVPMTSDQLKRIFDEAQPDFSAEVCPGAALVDLDPKAIAEFRRRWAAKAKRDDLANVSDERLLRDAELLVDGGTTYAALVLFGEHRALGKSLAQSEIIFEYRSQEASISSQQRKEFRAGFFSWFDELWRLIDSRNDLYSYQEGLFRYDLPAFNEAAVREALLNAVSHRDYRLAGSIFVKQFPAKLQVTSPGGFPPGVTAENIVFKQAPRNRRIAEALGRCGLIERSGQGADRMFGAAIREGKLPPSFSGTDAYQVAITLHGKVQDESFLVFLERLTQERQATLHIDDLLVLDAIHRQLDISDNLKERIPPLVELGALERVGRGRGVRHLLAPRYYKAIGKPGAYTRKRGLDRDTNKALLLKHVKSTGSEGCPLGDLLEVLPGLSRAQVQTLLREMTRDGIVHPIGLTRAGRWFAGPRDEGNAP